MSFFKSKKSKYKFTNSILDKLEKNSEVQVSLANLVIDDYFKFDVKERVEMVDEIERELIISEDGFKLLDKETEVYLDFF